MFEFLKFGKNKSDGAEPEVKDEHAEEEVFDPAEAERDRAAVAMAEEEFQQEAEAQYEAEEFAATDEKDRVGYSPKRGPENKGVKGFFKKAKRLIVGKDKRDKVYKDRKILGNSFVVCFLTAFAINMFIETIGRLSEFAIGGVKFLFEHPLLFLANTMIIYMTLLVAALFRRRTFVLAIVSSLWIAIGIANGVILTQRMTPFNMKDLTALGDGATLMTNYFTIPEMVLLFGGIAAAIIAFIMIFIRCRVRPKIHYVRTIAGIVASWAAGLGLIVMLIQAGQLSTFFGSLPYAYRDYGVPYCFTNTWLNTGIHKPAGYSASAVQALFDEKDLSKEKTIDLKYKDISTNNDDYPNVLFLQLESFIDPLKFRHVAFSEDPIPYFRKLSKEHSSGSLTVPACGAGTANTECEFMTGLSMHFFGPGEYPFKSVLSKTPTESVARDLSSIGYSTHAIHNHRALFYNRNEVFANMGYDTFTSVEYMSDIEKTPKGWAKDFILTSQIMDALTYTDQKDYVYTISVQGHGQYPSEKLLSNPEITVTKAPNATQRNKYEYYANEVHEMDQFIKELTDTLSKYKEKVVLVMYGDHIPALDISEENYDAKDLFQTQYVVWTNYETEKKDMDICAYELPAEVLARNDIHVGATTIYHQTHDHKDKDFLPGLKMLGYDMIYGKHYIYGGENPFKASDMKLGVKDIEIDKVVEVSGKYYIKGKNFTEESKVTLDGEPLDTVYLSKTLLGLMKQVDPEDVGKMKVSQIDRNTSTIISTTE